MEKNENEGKQIHEEWGRCDCQDCIERRAKQKSAFVSTTIPNFARKKRVITTRDLPSLLSTIHGIEKGEKKNE